MKKRNADEGVIDDEVLRYKQERSRGHEEDQDVKEAIKRSHVKRPNDTIDNDDSDMNGQDSDESEVSVTKGKGGGSTRGRGRGRGSRGGRGESKTSTRGSRGGRGGRGKTPVIEDSQRSIKDSFLSSSKSRSSKKFDVM